MFLHSPPHPWGLPYLLEKATKSDHDDVRGARIILETKIKFFIKLKERRFVNLLHLSLTSFYDPISRCFLTKKRELEGERDLGLCFQNPF